MKSLQLGIGWKSADNTWKDLAGKFSIWKLMPWYLQSVKLFSTPWPQRNNIPLLPTNNTDCEEPKDNVLLDPQNTVPLQQSLWGGKNGV